MITFFLSILFFSNNAVAFIPNHSFNPVFSTNVMKFIDFPPEIYESYSSEPMKLDVSVATTSGVQCVWFLDNTIISSSERMLESNSKMESVFQSMILISNLTIECPREGKYTYSCTNGLEHIEAHTTIKSSRHSKLQCTNSKAPRIQFHTDFVISQTGGTAVLFCESNHIGLWVWSKNGKIIRSNDKYTVSLGSLTIQNLGFEDSDDYRCSVLTAHGLDTRVLTLLTIG